LKGGRLLAMSAAMLIASIAAARCVVTLLPELWFDVDPVLDPTRVPGVSPGLLMIMDAVLLGAASAGLLGEAVRRRGGSSLLLVLWFIPLGSAAVWAWVGVDQVRVLLPWVAGITAAVAMSHLCRDATIRRAATAVLLAIVGPLLLRGLVQWGWDLPETARWFSENRDAAIASMGMDAGSAEALVYERRVRTGGPTGWFTSANLLATVLAASAIAWFGFVVTAKVHGRSALVGGIGVTVVVLAAIVTALTGSLGGVLVLVVGLGLAIAGLSSELIRRRGGWIALGLVLLAAIAPVLAAGMASLSHSLPGVRSMVIRWQYDIGAARVLANHPILGAGPSGFQDAYAASRLPGAPEEITSPHAMLWEWTSTLGVLGAAWVALVLVLLWSAATRGWRTAESVPGRPWWPIGAAVLALIPAAMVACSEWNMMDDAGRFVRIVGWMSMPVLAWIAWRCLVGLVAGWVVLSAVVILVMHAQIEMSLHQAASSVWILVLLGASAPTRGRGGRGLPMLGGVVAAALCAGAVVVGVLPQMRQDRLVVEAADLLISAPGDATPAEDAIVRDRAAERLIAAFEVGHDPAMLIHAAEQHIAAARGVLPDRAAASEWLSAAAAEAEQAHAIGRIAGGQLALEALDGQSVLGVPEAAEQAIELAERLCREDPSAAMVWINLGRLRDRAGDTDAACRAWRVALELDDANVIDPLQRLSAEVRSVTEQATSGCGPH
jgi:hypothetical protein